MANKYIILKAGGLELPVVFSENMAHAAVARSLGNTADVVGAGFFTLNSVDEEAIAYGESFSLNVKARKVEDSKILTRLLFESRSIS